MTNFTMGPKQWALLFILSILWGGSFIFNEFAIADLPPLTVSLGRVGTASIMLIAILYSSGQRLPTAPRVWGAFLIMGVLNNVIPFSLIAWGQIYIDSGLAAILNSTTPLFGIILGYFFTDTERISANRLVGIGLGMAGVVVLIGPGVLAGFSLANLGQVAVLGASLSYAVAAIFGHRFSHMPPLVTATGMLISSTLTLIPIVFLIDQPWQMSASLSAIWAILGLALLSTVFAYQIYFTLLASAGSTNLLLVTLLIPVSAIILASLFRGEAVSRLTLIGMLLISAGLVAIDGRLVTRRKIMNYDI